MAQIATIGSQMTGNVRHHAGHILHYDSDNSPVYCSGHSVAGAQQTGVSKFLVSGKPVAVVSEKGTTNCACDGQGYTNVEGSAKFLIGGKPVARVGDRVDIHGSGEGKITTGIAKFLIP